MIVTMRLLMEIVKTEECSEEQYESLLKGRPDDFRETTEYSMSDALDATCTMQEFEITEVIR